MTIELTGMNKLKVSQTTEYCFNKIQNNGNSKKRDRIYFRRFDYLVVIRNTECYVTLQLCIQGKTAIDVNRAINRRRPLPHG